MGLHDYIVLSPEIEFTNVYYMPSHVGRFTLEEGMKLLRQYTFALLLVLMFVSPVLSTEKDKDIASDRSVQEFITPDGRFDLEAARASGYQGALDLKGVDIRLDAISGQPLFNQSDANTPTDHPDDIYWESGHNLQGIDGMVYAMTIYNGLLIVGGYFDVACDAIAYNIASWDGSSWSPLGSGMSGTVYALTVYDNNLIAGGSFITAGDVTAHHIASWNGSDWDSLGSWIYGDVSALTVYDSLLIAGGDFTSAGGVTANYIASWEGSDWDSLGSGIYYGEVYALPV